MNRYLVSFLFAVGNLSFVYAQDYRISLAPEIGIPLGDMTWSHKPGVGAKIAFSVVNEKRNVLRANIYSIAYTSFSPRTDTLLYSFNDLNGGGTIQGKAAFGKFQMFEFRVGLGYAISFTKKMAIDVGVGIGILQAKRYVYLEDALGVIDQTESGLGFSISSTIGLEYIATQSISITPYVAYSASLLQMSDASQGYEKYNSSSAAFFQYLTPGISFSYSF